MEGCSQDVPLGGHEGNGILEAIVQSEELGVRVIGDLHIMIHNF